MMPDDEEDSLLLLTFALLHDLARETNALQKTVKRELLLEGIDSNTSSTLHNSLPLKDTSFYRELEWHISEGQLSPIQTTRALNLILREVDFFRIMIQNFYGAITRNQPLVLDKKPVRLELLIKEVIDLFMFSAADKGVELRTHVKGAPTLSIDREMIYRVLVNVIDNAVKYSYSGVGSSSERFILIKSRRHSIHGDWMISVASYGVGITEEEILSGYIFEYGARGRRAADRGRMGTGIGLAEAKRIVEAHKGKIQVTSREETTEAYLTTVKIILPGAQVV